MTNSSSEPRRPQQPRALKTWNSLLDAAAELLSEGGYDGLNTNAVADRAGINISTLYRYFPNKQALLAKLLERFNQQQLAQVQSILATNSDKDERVGQILEGLVELMDARDWMPALNRALAASPELQTLQHNNRQQMVDMVVEFIPAGQGGPKLSGQRLQLVLTLLFEVFATGIQQVLACPNKQRPQMLKEVKCLLNSYLEHYR